MDALDVVGRIIDNPHLRDAGLRYCLVDDNKLPHKTDGSMASPNRMEDFVPLDEILSCGDLASYHSLGVSVQASGICAIDVDHCFSRPFDMDSLDERALDVISSFCGMAYIEFSFSGLGLRVLFISHLIPNYEEVYYIKNSNTHIEYYQPTADHCRYVTLTGESISDNPIAQLADESVLMAFLNKYMKRPFPLRRSALEQKVVDDRPLDKLMGIARYHYMTNPSFQNNWFDKAPGSNSNESERDYFLAAYIYDNITKDPDKIKAIFEQSDFFKSKDGKHVRKWESSNGRYFRTIYDKIRSTR